MGEGWFQDESRSLNLLCTLLLLLLHLLHLRSSDIRLQRLGTPAVNWSRRKSLNADAEGICLREGEKKLEGNCSAKHMQLFWLRLEDLKTKH